MKGLSDFIELVEKISSDTKVALPTGYSYRYAPYTCWKCGTPIVIFKWCNSLIEGDIKKPSEPIPRTIQMRHTNMSGETYWANTCPHCDNVQGDFFISLEPDSPFFGLGSDIANDGDSFEDDMEHIAQYYFDCIVGPEQREPVLAPPARARTNGSSGEIGDERDSLNSINASS